jgi:adenosine deaminase CECR1
MIDVLAMRFLPLASFLGLGLALAPRDFYSDREAVLASEAASFLGADIVLDDVEVAANAALMAKKHLELEEAFAASFYPPSQHFFQSRLVMETSGVFAALRAMPKGAALHVHDLSIASTDWIVSNLTYWPNLFMCDNGNDRFWSFAWLLRPDGGNVSSCDRQVPH